MLGEGKKGGNCNKDRGPKIVTFFFKKAKIGEWWTVDGHRSLQLGMHVEEQSREN